MVAPITSKPAEVINHQSGSYSVYYSDKRPWKQVKPYNLPLPYEHKIAHLREYSANSGSLAPSYGADNFATSIDWYNRPESVVVRNLSYERLIGELGERASLAVALAELPQSIQMITKRLGQLATFANHLRKGRFMDAAKQLGLLAPPKKVNLDPKRSAKNFASNYLEFHFGWSPLIMDIYSAIEVLQAPFPLVPVRGRASTPVQVIISSGTPSSGIYTERAWVGEIRCVQGCNVRIDNPALYFANSLGLTNPATIAYELIPFSFVLNWFVNVESFISSMTDFLGLEVTDPFHSVSIKPGSACSTYRLQYFIVPPIGTKFGKANGTFGYQKRALGLSTPTLSIRPWRLPGYRRCLAAISLVVQQLTKG